MSGSTKSCSDFRFSVGDSLEASRMQFTLLCRVWSGGVNWLLGWWHMVQAMWRGDTWRTMTNSAVAAVADSPVLRPLYTHCTASALSVCQLVVSVRQVIVRLTGAYAVTNAPTLWHSAYVSADWPLSAYRQYDEWCRQWWCRKADGSRQTDRESLFTT